MGGPASTGGKQVGRDARGRFVPGASGNLAGRAPGTRNRATTAVLDLLAGEAEALTRKAVELALGGDTMALRLCIERLAPPAKDRPVSIPLPRMGGADDASKAMAAVLAAMGDGTISPSEAAAMAGVVEIFRRTLETEELERRLSELEARQP